MLDWDIVEERKQAQCGCGNRSFRIEVVHDKDGERADAYIICLKCAAEYLIAKDGRI